MTNVSKRLETSWYVVATNHRGPDFPFHQSSPDLTSVNLIVIGYSSSAGSGVMLKSRNEKFAFIRREKSCCAWAVWEPEPDEERYEDGYNSFQDEDPTRKINCLYQQTR